MIVGQIGSDGWARPLRQAVAEAGRPALPPPPPPPAIDGEWPAGTTALEARALYGAGAAGRWLGSLAAASEARHLRRVVGWPIGAVAVGDTIYVNAAWLVALAPPDDGGPDDGADASVAPSASPAAAAAPVAVSGPPANGGSAAGGSPTSEVRIAALTYADGGVEVMPAQDPPTPSPDDQACSNFAVGCADACASSNTTDNGDACSDTSGGGNDDGGDPCSGSTDDGGDACTSSSDDSSQACASSSDDSSQACASSSDDSSQACANTSDDASAGCQVGRRPRPRGGLGQHGCLLLPLGYLLLIRRRR